MKAQVISLPNAKNSDKKKLHNQYEYDWRKIRRANDCKRFLSEKAVNILSNAVYRLQKKKSITYTHAYLTKHFTACKYEQNNNLIAQLKEVFDIEFRRSGTENGENYTNRFEFKINENTYKILEDPEGYYKKKSTSKPLKNSDNYTEKNKPSSLKKLSEQSEKIQTALYIHKETVKEELKNTAYSSVFFNSVLNVDRTCVDTDSEIVSQSIPTLKPRIRVQAEILKTSTILPEQTDLLCYPERAASQPCSAKEETMKAYDWDNPANKLDLAIVRNFDSAMAQELTIHVGYDYIPAENKMRLVFKKKLVISEQNKSRLKQLIKGIYGDDTEIVTAVQNDKKADVVKITRNQEKFQAHDEQPPQIQEIEEVFERFIPADEDELLKLADEIREKSYERAVNRDDDTFDFNARIEQLLATDPQIFRI